MFDEPSQPLKITSGLKSNRTRQKNETGDSKVESSDSPEILDVLGVGGRGGWRGGDIRLAWSPFGPSQVSGLTTSLLTMNWETNISFRRLSVCNLLYAGKNGEWI